MKKKPTELGSSELKAFFLLVILSVIGLLFSHSARAGQSLAPIISIKGKGLPAGFTLADNSVFSAFNTGFVPNLVIYADADTGSDSNPGTFGEPVKSVSAAQNLVRNSLAQNSNENVLVVLRGAFYLQQTLNLTAADSPANGHFVVWTSDPNEPATISGGQVLNLNWSLVSASLNLYSAPVGNYTFRNLIVNNQMAQRARLDLLRSAPLPQTGTVINCSGCGLPPITAPQPIEVVRDVQWIEDRCPATLNMDATITVSSSSCMSGLQRSYNIWPTYTTYVTALEGASAVTTQPGQWSLDTNQHLLYYIPLAGQNLATATVIAPQQANLVLLQNVKNLAFLNLTFSHSDWEGPSAPSGFSMYQADVLASGALVPTAFDCEGCQNVLVMDSQFSQLGTSALRIGPSSQNNLIFHNSIFDISGSGLQIGETQSTPPTTTPCTSPPATDPTETTYTYVEDNTILDVGQEYASSVGIFQIYAAHSQILHNEIDFTPYTAVSVGWGWTTCASTNSHDNLISSNGINGANEILTDGGGVYTLSAQSGTAITSNYIHNIAGGAAGLNFFLVSNGVYLDYGSSYITVAGNCMANITSQDVFQNPPNIGTAVDQATSCPSGTTAAAGVRPQASTAMTYVRMPDSLPIFTTLLLHE